MPELVITDAGLTAAIDAGNRGLSLAVQTIAVGDGRYEPVATQTELQNELARTPVISGALIGQNQLHLHGAFTDGAWTAYELGFLLDDGTLFAVHSTGPGGAPLLQKLAGVNIVQAFELVLSRVPAGSVSVETGIVNILGVGNATKTDRGVIRLSTVQEGLDGLDDESAVTPAVMQAKIDALVGAAPAVLDTLEEIANALRNDPNVLSALQTGLAARVRRDQLVHTLDTLLGSEDWRVGFNDTVLSDGFDLAARTRVDRAISQSLTNFRWVQMFAQIGDYFVSDDIIFPVSSIPAYVANTGSMYGVEGNKLYTINRMTGATVEAQTLNGTVPRAWRGLAVANGVLLGLGVSVTGAGGAIYSIDTANGSTEVAIALSTNSSSRLSGLAFDGTNFYTTDAPSPTFVSTSLYTINPSSGERLRVGGIGSQKVTSATIRLVWGGDNLYLVFSNETGFSGGDHLWRVDRNTAATTSVAAFSPAQGNSDYWQNIAWDGQDLYVKTSTRLSRVNRSSAALNFLGTGGSITGGMAWLPTSPGARLGLTITGPNAAVDLGLSRHPTNTSVLRFLHPSRDLRIAQIVGIP